MTSRARPADTYRAARRNKWRLLNKHSKKNSKTKIPWANFKLRGS